MTDLEMIKKDYGEKMSHFCRDNFSTILETDGLLYDILLDHFAPSKFLYDDIKNEQASFRNYIYSFLNCDREEVEVDKTPSELLDEAGYILYECKSEEDIQKFRKYYVQGEELCTFNGGRLDDCYVFFAVKKDVDEIKRYDFPNPMRQDKYGTSVISIQFTKGEVNTLSIKNRYNHKVENPDSTFSNDLENIIAGLTKSFEREYNLNINSNENGFELPGYVRASDGRFYKYNYEINNIYYCPNNIVIHHDIVQTDYMQNERYLILDYLILDLKEKKIFFLDDYEDDDIVERLNNIEKIEITKNKETGYKEIKIKTPDGNARIVITDKSIIKEYEDDMEKPVGDNFLSYSNYIEKVSMKKVRSIENGFLACNFFLKEFNLPNLRSIKDNFLLSNMNISYVYLPHAVTIGRNFMCRNKKITEFRAPEVLSIGDNFLDNCTKIEKIFADEVTIVGSYFLTKALHLKEIHMPKVRKFGYSAFRDNNTATELYLPSVLEIGDDFFTNNNTLKKVFMPNVRKIGNNVFLYNTRIEELEMPKDAMIGNCFLLYHPWTYAKEKSFWKK